MSTSRTASCTYRKKFCAKLMPFMKLMKTAKTKTAIAKNSSFSGYIREDIRHKPFYLIKTVLIYKCLTLSLKKYTAACS